MAEEKTLALMDKDGLHATNPKIAEELDRKQISPSLITGLEQCAAKWFASSFVLPKFIKTDMTAAIRGSAYHWVMEEFFKLPNEQRTKPEVKRIIKESFVHKDFEEFFIEQPDQKKWLVDAVRSYYEMGAKPQEINISKIEINGKEIEGIELFVKGQIGDTKRQTLGLVDRIRDHNKKSDAVVVEDWKGLALDTLLPTPTGWTTMGGVKEGEEILGTDGGIIKVLNKSNIHNRPCYLLSFNDSSEVVADNIHLWEVRIPYDEGEKIVTLTVDTDELYELWKKNPKKSIHIRNAKRITAFTEKDLPINPYLLGAWLGNGALYSGSINFGTDLHELLPTLQTFWGGKVLVKKSNKAKYKVSFKKPNPKFCSMGNKCKYGTRKKSDKVCKDCKNLRDKGLNPSDFGDNRSLKAVLFSGGLLNNKHVPIDYLRGSVHQRLELLRGLMDTNGRWNNESKRAVFYTENEKLAEAVAEIVVTLGVTPSFYKEDDYRDFYEVSFAPVGFNPFHLERKAVGAEEYLDNNDGDEYKDLHRYIESISKVKSVPTQCIKVDADDSLFLCGPLMVPTHNTGAKARIWKPNVKSDDGLPEQRQQIIYSMLLRDEGIDVAGASLIYPVAKEVVRVRINDENLKDRIVKDVEKTDRDLDLMIENNTFEYEPSFLCSWCPLARSCPEARLNHRSEKMMTAYNSQPFPEELEEGITFA